MEIKWIKLSTDIFNNRKIRQLEQMPDGDALIVIWLKLLTLAGNVNDGGLIYFTHDIPYTEQLLATQFNKSPTLIQLALSTFEKFEMIEIIDDMIHVSNWEKYQNVEEMEKIRGQNRLRKQKQREREKQALLEDKNIVSRDSHVTSQQSHATDIDIDIDIEKEYYKKERKPKSGYDVLIDEYTDNENLKKALLDFIKMRKLAKKPMTDKALKLLMSKLDRLGRCDGEKIAILDQSIMNSWQSVYELKEPYQESEEERKAREALNPKKEIDWNNVPF